MKALSLMLLALTSCVSFSSYASCLKDIDKKTRVEFAKDQVNLRACSEQELQIIAQKMSIGIHDDPQTDEAALYMAVLARVEGELRARTLGSMIQIYQVPQNEPPGFGEKRLNPFKKE